MRLLNRFVAVPTPTSGLPHSFKALTLLPFTVGRELQRRTLPGALLGRDGPLLIPPVRCSPSVRGSRQPSPGACQEPAQGGLRKCSGMFRDCRRAARFDRSDHASPQSFSTAPRRMLCAAMSMVAPEGVTMDVSPVSRLRGRRSPSEGPGQSFR